MNDKTLQQSDQERLRSRDLSLQSTKPPAKIAGYSIEQFIGSGAYGEVWSGTEKKTGRRVAIKFYTRRSKDDIELLASEVEKLVALSADRYVVQLVDVDWQADPPYFVMDYFEHGSLEDLLKDEKTLPVGQAEDLFTEIARGMMHLHGKGIFHCDLKPGNILLDQDGKPRLADFGQARLRTDQSSSLGTLFFMAPEQADLKAVPAAKWDVYALGAILYSMLVGKPPYHDEKLTDKIGSSASVEERLSEYKSALKLAPAPTEHRNVAGVDNLLAEIIDRALAVNPAERFDSVESVLVALRQRELVKARRPLLILGLIGPLLLLTVMSLFSWFASRQAYSDTQDAIFKETKNGNNFAAKMAASSAAEKIDRYFRAVEELAQDKEFIEDFQDAIGDADLMRIARELDDPNVNSDNSLEPSRQDYRDNPTRLRLQPHLEKRIADPQMQYASWFVNDVRGMQIASIFSVSPDTITIGRNYSYRTYFTGFERDLKQNEGDQAVFDVKPLGVQRPMIDRPHLSAVFLSKGTFTWKVAFSAPVYHPDSNPNEPEIIGIVACTAEMGNFVDFENNPLLYAMLVDGREGLSNGIVLEHPVFTRLTRETKKVPRIEVDLEKVGQTDRFVDPMSELPEAATYGGDSIASIQPVASPRFANPVQSGTGTDSGDAKGSSGLFVIVAEDYNDVIRPVEQLSSRLFWLAIYATLFFLVVALMLWLFVLRMLREANSRLIRSFAPSDMSFRNSADSD